MIAPPPPPAPSSGGSPAALASEGGPSLYASRPHMLSQQHQMGVRLAVGPWPAAEGHPPASRQQAQLPGLAAAGWGQPYCQSCVGSRSAEHLEAPAWPGASSRLLRTRGCRGAPCGDLVRMRCGSRGTGSRRRASTPRAAARVTAAGSAVVELVEGALPGRRRGSARRRRCRPGRARAAQAARRRARCRRAPPRARGRRQGGRSRARARGARSSR